MIDHEEREHLISLRIEQAENTIQEAQSSLENGNYSAAANRIYYGMFYAVLALGLLHQFETTKHMQLIGWFNKNFIRTGIFSPEIGSYLKTAFETRTNSDYKVNRTPTTADLEALLADMKTFISTIKAWLEANPAA